MRYLSLHLGDLSYTATQWGILKEHLVNFPPHQPRKVLEIPHTLQDGLYQIPRFHER